MSVRRLGSSDSSQLELVLVYPRVWGRTGFSSSYEAEVVSLFFSRKHARSTDPPTGVPCYAQGCTSTDARRCSYTDRNGHACPTAWCPDHSRGVSGLSYCRRHAGVARALEVVSPDERQPPDLDNRAPSLCAWMAEALDHGARAIVADWGAQHAGSSMSAGPLALVISRQPAARGWEYRWLLSDHTGRLLSVAVRVEEQADSLVQVRVNGGVVAAEVPPWITQRMAETAEDDRVRRLAFDNRLLQAALAAVKLQP